MAQQNTYTEWESVEKMPAMTRKIYNALPQDPTHALDVKGVANKLGMDKDNIGWRLTNLRASGWARSTGKKSPGQRTRQCFWRNERRDPNPQPNPHPRRKGLKRTSVKKIESAGGKKLLRVYKHMVKISEEANKAALLLKEMQDTTLTSTSELDELKKQVKAMSKALGM